MGCGSSSSAEVDDNSRKPKVVFVLGGPGSGKGTQCALIIKKFGYIHLSAGDLLRDEVARKGPRTQEIEDCMKNGQLVPNEIILDLIKRAMLYHGWSKSKFLIDGYPRNKDNLDGWEQVIGNTVDLQFVLVTDCSKETMKERILQRAKTSGRVDDNEESLVKRFDVYQQQTQPIIEHFEKLKKVVKVDANRSQELVFADIAKAFSRVEGKPKVIFILGGPGSGKGTQSELIVKNYGWVHLSTGDLLREEKARKGPNAAKIEEAMKAGQLVSNDIVVELLKDAMHRYDWNKSRFIIDGFPRSEENLKAWREQIEDIVDFRKVIVTECPFDVLKERVLGSSGKSDVDEASLQKQYDVFTSDTKHVLDYYEKQSKVVRINGNRSKDEVFADVKNVVEQIDPSKQGQNTQKPNVVFVLGGPGSGKGTQCERIIKNFGWTHLSTGDLLREESSKEGPLSQEIKDCMKEGKLVADEVIVKLLQKAMQERGWEKSKFLIDGFPRSEENFKVWKQIIGDSVNLRFVLFTDCSLETMKTRILERAKTSGRVDDNEESLVKRFEVFKQQTQPVINYYEREHKVVRVDANRTTEEVYADVAKAFESIEAKPKVVFVLGGPGSGKGTQCERIIKKYGWVHLSAGDLLREEASKQGPLADQINDCMKNGKLVSNEIIIAALKNAMHSRGWAKSKFLIDGFPRSEDNLMAWQNILAPNVDLQFVLLTDCSLETMKVRILERAKTSGRVDDNEESLVKRFEVFQQQTQPVINYYSRQQKVVRVDANRTPDDVFKDISTAFDSISQ